MPEIAINGCNVAYEEHGTGLNTVVFLHDLFFNGRCFNQQILALRDRFRCITIDLRGHGESRVTAEGYALDTLAHDVTQFIDVKRFGACHVVGAGFGGTVAARAALTRPSLIKSLTLIGTSLNTCSDRDLQALKSRRLHIKLFGLRFVTKSLLRRAFSPAFLNDPNNKEVLQHWQREFLKLDRRELPHAIAAYMVRPRLLDALYTLKLPTLILGGDSDSVVTPDDLMQVDNRLAHSALEILTDTGRAAHIEKPNTLNPFLLEFLSRL
ncbi:MAG: alpha/beta hydrolase [Pseudomonadota bacterium]